MNPICTTIIILIVLGFAWVYRHAIDYAFSYIFMPKKKRRFVSDNKKVLGGRYSAKFWDMYN
jgi:hypothetical protein